MIDRGNNLVDNKSGFTLLEILVTLTVMTVIFGIFIVDLTPTDSAIAADEGERLAWLLEAAAAEANAAGRPVGIRFNLAGDRYDVWRLDPDKGWEEIDEKTFSPYQFTLGTTVSFSRIDGRPVTADNRLFFLPGDGGPLYQVILRHGAVNIQYHSTPIGEIILVDDHDV